MKYTLILKLFENKSEMDFNNLSELRQELRKHPNLEYEIYDNNNQVPLEQGNT